MPIWIYVFGIIFILLWVAYGFFLVLNYRILRFEKKILEVFTTRTDNISALYEVTKDTLQKHAEIFDEVLALRKKEFTLMNISHTLESCIELEKQIHHEINFIFQVCNKNPGLIKKKEFLYIRDIMMSKSHEIWQLMKKYKKIIEIYNTFIQIKNFTLIGLILPFSKKTVL